MVFIEALASEAVVVTSDIAPMNEFMTHHANGILVKDYENPQSLASAIQEACTDTALRVRLKKNSRTSVERFERSKIDQLEAGFYQKIFSMKQQRVFDVPFWQGLVQHIS